MRRALLYVRKMLTRHTRSTTPTPPEIDLVSTARPSSHIASTALFSSALRRASDQAHREALHHDRRAHYSVTAPPGSAPCALRPQTWPAARSASTPQSPCRQTCASASWTCSQGTRGSPLLSTVCFLILASPCGLMSAKHPLPQGKQHTTALRQMKHALQTLPVHTMQLSRRQYIVRQNLECRPGMQVEDAACCCCAPPTLHHCLLQPPQQLHPAQEHPPVEPSGMQ